MILMSTNLCFAALRAGYKFGEKIIKSPDKKLGNEYALKRL